MSRQRTHRCLPPINTKVTHYHRGRTSRGITETLPQRTYVTGLSRTSLRLPRRLTSWAPLTTSVTSLIYVNGTTARGCASHPSARRSTCQSDKTISKQYNAPPPGQLAGRFSAPPNRHRACWDLARMRHFPAPPSSLLHPFLHPLFHPLHPKKRP